MPRRGVCVVTHPLSSAGENATRTLLDILAAIGPVSLVTADLPEESSIRDHREVIELTQKGAGDHVLVAAFRFLLNQIRMCLVLRRRPESVVLFFGATSYLIPILYARMSGKTVLVEPRGDVPLTLRLNWEQRMPSPMARGLAKCVGLLESAGFAAAHRVVTYTPNMARELGSDPESDRVCPHGARYVDTEHFSIQKPFSERDNIIGFVGRLDEEKGIRELAEVTKRLPDNVAFRFIGDGPLYDWLATELSREIDDGIAELAGWVDHEDIPVELNRMKLLVMPSHPTEGLPTTILESLACGTPVYATPVSGVPDVVKEGETGFLMREREAETIADDIEEIMSAERDLEAISERGRALIEDEYSFEAAQKRYRELLSDIESNEKK
ncbi:glycosyltransferase family 4 protein [Halobellus rubicundus]|uniref:Glycosyltransferase family 4 protein n=1 Tax=Halobellus rubicundus TaxID=2996466 RepID=A0ABD5MG25_9EURY